MTKIDIFSGFLGAGKTTLIKKLLKEALSNEKVVLIENEFGEIGIDGGFMKEAGIEVTEMNSGCICCSLVGDFGVALRKVIEQYHPDRILIEPSGVGKLSDVIRAVEGVEKDIDEAHMGSFVTVADAMKCRMYIKNFGEFFLNQIEYAGTILLSRTGKMSQSKLEAAVALLREHNDKARIITTPWDELTGEQILAAMEQDQTLAEEMLETVMHEHHHDHEHHHEHDEHCTCGCHDHDHEHEHHHEHDEHCTCGCHDHDHEHEHHHEHDEHCTCGCHDHDHEHDHEHEHHHEHDEHCTCGCHDHEHHHDHHGHHHADEVFTSWGVETVKAFGEQELSDILTALDGEAYGVVLRAKGIIPCAEGGWLHFDYTPGEQNIRKGAADVTGRLCVIGSGLKEEGLKELFGV
ncbi:MAG: GTP-binding protein [Christensenellales bacterium]|nr:GTP-binding protein [Christensenellales bacterium]